MLSLRVVVKARAVNDLSAALRKGTFASNLILVGLNHSGWLSPVPHSYFHSIQIIVNFIFCSKLCVCVCVRNTSRQSLLSSILFKMLPGSQSDVTLVTNVSEMYGLHLYA